jgi:hypothetical protein
MHHMALAGKDIGMWFGPSAAAGALRLVCFSFIVFGRDWRARFFFEYLRTRSLYFTLVFLPRDPFLLLTPPLLSFSHRYCPSTSVPLYIPRLLRSSFPCLAHAPFVPPYLATIPSLSLCPAPSSTFAGLYLSLPLTTFALAFLLYISSYFYPLVLFSHLLLSV